jgi:chromosome segregation ATPase
MTVEIHDKLIALLAEVDELKGKEAQVKSEKTRHLEQIAQSEGETQRCDNELGDIRENQLRLKREMDALRDELFHRDEDDAPVVDEAHVPTEDGASAESQAKRSWNERAAHLRKVGQ